MSLRLKPLDRQAIVITGASSGIGLATARMAAKAGASVLLVARNGAALEEIVAGITAEGGSAAFAVADVADADALTAAADVAIHRFGRIDTWVSNAGVAIYCPLLDTPEDEHQRMFQTNYFGVVHSAKLAARHLGANGGAFITVASVAADMPSPVMGAYAASKHAVKGYIESLRIELMGAGVPISISLVKPSGISTPIAQHAANHLAGEAKIPPLVYDPALVAQAILDCAVRPRREITVGGAGRAQVLFATHFPGLFQRLAPLITPLLSSDRIAKTHGDALAHHARDGAERSPNDPGRGVSAYTSAMLHPRVTGAVALGGAAVAWWALSGARRRRKT